MTFLITIDSKKYVTLNGRENKVSSTFFFCTRVKKDKNLSLIHHSVKAKLIFNNGQNV